MKKNVNRCLSLVFSLILLFSVLAPMAPAYADGTQTQDIQPESEQLTVPTSDAGVNAQNGEAPQTPEVPGSVPVTAVEISAESYTVSAGQSVQLSAIVSPDSATLQTVSWSVISGTGEGMIDEYGLFTGLTPGFVTVRASANDGFGAFADCELSIIPDTEPTSEPSEDDGVNEDEPVQINDSVLLLREGASISQYQVSGPVYSIFSQRVQPGLTSMAFEIDVSDLLLSPEIIHDAYQKLLNEDLTLTNVSGDYSLLVSGGVVQTLIPSYLLSAEQAQSEERRVQKAIRDILKECVSDDMSDMQKALAVHDYFCCHFQYAYDGGYGHNYTYLLLEGRGVCQAYADAYSKVMQAAGVTCRTVNSNAMTHSWNMINIDDEWYHVDITWDDRYNSNDDVALAYAQHRYFLLSDSAIFSAEGGHHDLDNAPAAANSDKYDNYFWRNIDTPICVTPDSYYYAQPIDGSSSAIMCCSASSPSTVQTVKTVSIAQPGCMGLASHGGRLYYNDNEQLFSCLPDGSDQRTEAAPQLPVGSSISRLYVFQDTLYYGVGTNGYLPNEVRTLALSAGRPVTAISLPGTVYVAEGKSGRFTAEISPSDASVRTLSWVSSDPEVLSVDASAGTYHALTIGTATVTATATDGGGASASCAVTVGDGSQSDAGYSAVTPTLKMTNLVVFVRFAGDTDDDFNALGYKPKRTVWTELKERYDNAVTTASDSTYLNYVDDSFCAYMNEVSCGKARISNVFPQDYIQDGKAMVSYIDLSLTRAQVGDDNEVVIDEVIDAFSNGELTLPTGTVLDQRESGVLDNLTIVIQGASEEYTDSIMRSHKGVSGTNRKIGGKLVRNYNVLCGDALISSRASLIAHEFLHSVGLPDLYRYAGNGDPVGVWDIMASEGSFLQYPLSYQRYVQGWIDLDEITQSGDYYLTSPLKGGGNQGFIIRSPLNEAEFFVVEYREKNTDPSLRGFELKIPTDGVIVYRVNTTVENLTNAFGNDYIYVFRDDETGLTDSYSADRLNTGAAITAGQSRGSSDLSADFTHRTIFYSDGANSGIVITAVGVQPDGTMKINVSYPDYSALGLWDKLGTGPAAASAQDGCSLAMDGMGNLYAAYIEPASTGDMLSSYGVVKVLKWTGTQWVSLGSPGQTDGLDVSLVCFNNVPYVGYQKRGGGAVASRYTSAWSTVSCGAGVSDVRLACDGDNLFSVSLSGGSTLCLSKLNSSKTAFSALGTQTGSYFSAPALTVFNGQAVVVCNDVFTSGSKTLVLAYDESLPGWATLGELPNADRLAAVCRGGRLWVLHYPQMAGRSLYLSCYDGESWSSDLTYSAPDVFSEYSLDVYGNSPVMAVNPSFACGVYTVDDGVFTQCGYTVRSDAQRFSLMLDGATAYIAVTGGDNTLNVYKKAISGVSSDARLSSLSAGDAKLSPAFSPYTYSYTAEVTTDTAELDIAAVPVDSGSVVEGTGTKELAYGVNTFTVTVTAADGFSTLSYELRVNRRPIPATAVKLKPTTVSLLTGDTMTLTCALTPANTTDTVSFTSSDSSVASVDPITGEVAALAPGKTVIKAKASSGKYAQCTVSVSYLSSAVTVESSSVTPGDIAVIDNTYQTVLLDQADALSVTGGYKLRLRASVYDSNGQRVTGAVTWTSSDTSLGTVSVERATGDALLTVKGLKNGIFRVKAVSTDKMKKESHVTVYVRDYEPRIDVTSVKLNPWLSEGISVDILPSYGNEISSAELLTPVKVGKVTSYQPSPEFSLTRKDGTNTWIINNTDTDGNPVKINNSTVRARVRLSTDKGEYQLPLSIIILNQQPTISVQQKEKFNLFYTDSAVQLAVSAKGAALVSAELSGTPTFKSAYSEGELTVSYADTDLPSTGYVSGKPVLKGKLLVSLEGYNWPVPKALTLSTVTVKPAFVLSAVSALVNTAVEPAPSVSFYLMDKASRSPVHIDNGAELAKLSVPGFAAVSDDGDNIRLSLQMVKGKYVGGTATLSIQQNNWLTPVQYPFKVSVVTALPSAKVSGPMDLSSVFASTDDFASLPVILSQNNLSLKPDRIVLSSTNTSAETALDVVYEDSRVTAAFKPSFTDPAQLKNGSYVFKFIPMLDDGGVGTALKPISVTVRVSNSVPTVKINTLVVNKLGYNSGDSAAPAPYGESQLIVTNNGSAVVKAAAGGGAQNVLIDGTLQTLVTAETKQSLKVNAEMLNVTYENGTVTAAVTNPDVKPGNYRFTLPLMYSDGGIPRGSKALVITVKVISEAPTLKLSTRAFKLNRSLGGDTATCIASCGSQYYELSNIVFSPVTSPAVGAILPDYSNGKVSVTSSGLTVNKTYSYKAVPYFTDKITGCVVSGAPVTVSVNVYSATPKATVSARGTLNAIAREDSKLDFTLTGLSGMAGEVDSYILSGNDADRFDSALSFVKGKPVVTLTLKADESYALTAKYIVRIGFKTASADGFAYTSNLTVRVTQPALKLSNSKTGFILFQSGHEQTFITRLTITSPAVGTLQSVSINKATGAQLISALELAEAEPSADGRGILQPIVVKDSSGLKVNGKYTLVLDVLPAGSATDAKPTQIKITVTVRP